jgi:hypothetical protein
MQEENSINEPNSVEEEENSNEWQAPPPPEKIPEAEPAQMSEPATLGSIFFEPGETFEDLRRKPRFILGSLIIIILFSVFNVLFIQKVGFERIIRDRLESNSRIQQMPEADKQKMIEQQSSPVVKAISYAAVPVVMIIVFLIGGLLYWLAANAMGGTMKFSQGLSVWVYSMFPPTVISIIANIIVLFLKNVDDIDILTSQNGLIKANPSFLVNAKTAPALATFLASLDLFAIWGWILAAIGLQRVARLSSGSAWAVVLILALVGIALKVLIALIFG